MSILVIRLREHFRYSGYDAGGFNFFCIRRYFHRIYQEILPQKTHITNYIYYNFARVIEIRNCEISNQTYVGRRRMLNKGVVTTV